MSLRHRVFLHFILGIAAIAWSAVAECQALKPPQPATQSPNAPNATPGAPVPIPEPGEIFRDCPDCSEMVVVPAGEFKMGSGDTVSDSGSSIGPRSRAPCVLCSAALPETAQSWEWVWVRPRDGGE